MSERVVLADCRPNGGCELLGTQWADTDSLLQILTENDRKLRTAERWTKCGRGDWQSLVDDLSYLTLDLCLRRTGPDTSAYLPVWAGIPVGASDQTPDQCGVLVRVDSLREYDRLRQRLQARKAKLGAAIERGDIDTETAQRQLLADGHLRIEFVAASACGLL